MASVQDVLGLDDNAKAWIRGLLAFGENPGQLHDSATALADAAGIEDVTATPAAANLLAVGAACIGALWDGNATAGAARIADVIEQVSHTAARPAGDDADAVAG